MNLSEVKVIGSEKGIKIKSNFNSDIRIHNDKKYNFQ